MDSSSSSDINIPLKKSITSVITVGNVTLVPLEKSIVKRLGITEGHTCFQEEIVNDGILLRIIREESKQK